MRIEQHQSKVSPVDVSPQLTCQAIYFIERMVRSNGFLQGAESGVRVNSVAPGPVDTPILEVIPREQLLHLVEASQLLSRITQPEEVRVNII